MTPADPLDAVRAIFREEGTELLARLDEGVLKLERSEPGARAAIVEEMMRTAHNLKGTAGSIGLEATADLAHALESVLGKPEALSGSEVFDVLHRGLDALRGSLEDRRLSERGTAALGALGQLLGDVTGKRGPQARGQVPAGVVPAAATALTEIRAEESARIPLTRLSELMLEVGEVSLRLQGAAERTRTLRALTDQLSAITLDLKGAPSTASAVVSLLAVTQRGIVAALNQFEAEAARDVLAGEALHASIRTLRLRPLSTVFRLVPRMARDLGRALGKEVQVTVSGASLEVEKNLIDVLSDALMHLVRNSMDHGIEAPAQRAARNKPAQGQLHLAARVQGSRLVVELGDDGGGVDPARVRKAVVAARLMSEVEANALSDEEASDLIFRAGLSTKETASQVSGRGVGLDAVRTEVEHHHGTIRVESRLGQGATFVLSLPLQSHRTHVLLLRIGAERLAVPTQAIWKVVRGAGQRPVEVAGQPFLLVESVAVPIVQLSPLLWGAPPSRLSEQAPLIVLRLQGRAVAFSVDELLHDEVVVVRELEPPMVTPPLLSGVAVRSGGDVMCILNPVELVRIAGVHAPMAAAEVKRVPARARRVLVVDDSFTVRALEKSILELAGYSVLVAGDGEEALGLLAHEEVDLVVSDVNMPRRDGFELLSAVRQSPRLRTLPFILVTSRSSDADRRKGLELGASAYVVKTEFDQEVLVDAVARLAG